MPRDNIGGAAEEYRRFGGHGTLDDFATTECILILGQNTASNSPRALHALQHATRRNVPIIVFDPLRERALERFADPQSPIEMLMGQSTRIASQYHQVKAGGDLAALAGTCKYVVEQDALDHGFIAEHTHGFEEFAEWLRRQEWDRRERRSG